MLLGSGEIQFIDPQSSNDIYQVGKQQQKT